MNEIASAVRKARLSKGWSYRRLAKEAGTALPTAHRLEHGQEVVLSGTVSILKALGLSWVPVCEHEYVCRHCGERS